MRSKWLRPARLLTFSLFFIFLVIVYEHHWKKSHNEGLWKLWDPLSERKMKLTVKSKGVEYYEAIRLVRSQGSPWPPKSVLKLRDPKTGFYDMKIRPKYVWSADKPLSGLDKYVQWLEKSASKLRWKGSKLRKMVYVDRFSENNNNEKANLFLYPLVLDLPTTVRAVKAGMEVDKEPINDPDLFVIKSPSKVCNPHKPKPFDLIVIMKSCAECFAERNDVRDEFANLTYWSDFRISVLFATGLPSQNRIFDYLKFKNSFLERLMHPFYPKANLKLNRNLGLRKLFWEYEKYDDLLIGSFLDTYYNLTLKQLFMFRWASSFCRNQTRLFLFMDHDQTLIPKNAIQFVRNITDSRASRLVGGVLAQETLVVRDSWILNTKWEMSYDQYPWSNYPPYPQGAIYLIGAKIIEDIAIASVFTKRFPFEDVYLGIVAYKLNVNVVSFSGFWLNRSRQIDWSNAITVRSRHMRKIFNWKTNTFKPWSWKSIFGLD